MTKHKSKQLQQLQQLQQLHQLQQMQQLQQAQQVQHARPHVHRQPSLGNGGLPPSRPQSAQSAQMLADSNSGSFLLRARTLPPGLSFPPDSLLFQPRLGMGGRMGKTQLPNVWRVPGL